MRTQSTKLKTGKKKRLVLLTIAGILLLTSVILYLVDVPQRAYEPPAFDTTAVDGQPKPDKGYAYDEVIVENGFSFYAAGCLYQQEDRTVKVFLTNPENSGYILLCEIVDNHGKLLYKSGAIQQGKYVESLKPVSEFPNEAMDVEIRVYAFEPDTWYSRGTIFLTNKLQPW